MSEWNFKEAINKFKNRKRYSVLNPTVLASIPDEDLVQAILDHILDVKVGNRLADMPRILERLSTGFRIIEATLRVENEVRNGGFNQFFHNGGTSCINDAIEGFRLIGAPKTAVLTENALSVYKEEIPFHNAVKNDGSLEAFSESYEHTRLNDLDSQFYGLYEAVEPLAALRIQYIRTHPNEFISE